MPEPEVLMWSKLRAKRLLGQRFRRQHSIGHYVVDFYCPGLRLAVEIDGDSHFQPGIEEQDRRRQAFIESFGVQFLRFTNQEVTRNLNEVLAVIGRFVEERNPLPP